MKILISVDDLAQLKSKELVPIECGICKSTFYKTKNLVLRGLKGTRKIVACSNDCRRTAISQSKFHGNITLKCTECKTEFNRKLSDYKKWNVKSNKQPLCSRRCVSINTAKKGFTSRSKFEVWIEENLKRIYPNLEVNYNDRKTLSGLELDIFIPSLNLAFELNGIFHYEPIYGEEKLLIRKKFDKAKIQDCIEKKISLCIIDISKIKRLKPKRDKIYLNIITNLINQNLERKVRVEQTLEFW